MGEESGGRWRGGGDGRGALYYHRWGDHRRLRGASAAGGRRNLEAVPNTGFFLRSGGDAAGPRESGKCASRTIRRAARRNEEKPRAAGGYRRAEGAPNSRRDRGGRAQVLNRVQRESQYTGCGHRKQNCESDPLFVRRAAVREVDGRGAESAQRGASVHQPDGLRTDADAPRL